MTVIGIIHDETFEARMVRALVGLIRNRDIGPTLYVEVGGGNLDRGRNVLVQKFLTTDEEWLLQIDTDQFFGLEQYDRIMETAVGRDIVSGVYFTSERPPRPVMARWGEDGHAEAVTEWDEHEILDVDSTGAGFLLVNRSVFEKMNHPEEYKGRAGSWFTQDKLGPAGQLLNEDSSFCLRAQEHGYRVYVDTDCFVGHIKKRILGVEV